MKGEFQALPGVAVLRENRNLPRIRLQLTLPGPGGSICGPSQQPNCDRGTGGANYCAPSFRICSAK